MAYIVSFYNFGTSRHVATLEEAKAVCIKAAFDAAVFRLSHDGKTAGDIVARYGSISGWRQG